MKQYASVLGIQLRRLRVDQRLTQEELAEQVHVHPTYIAKLESGSRLPSLRTLLRLAEALNCPPSQLMVVLDRNARTGIPRTDSVAQRIASLLRDLSPGDLELAEGIVRLLREHRRTAGVNGEDTNEGE